MEIIGYLSAIVIGILLGLIGGGGSILTVPVLVYLFKIDALLATSYSLFIVGITSSIGSFDFIKNKLINYKSVLLFGIPSVISVFATRAYLLPAIPNTLITVGSLMITKHTSLLLLFAVLMIAASYSMIKKNKTERTSSLGTSPYNFLLLLLEGIVVGVVTGLVGAGGGFLIIPVLVMMGKLPMKVAIGTSLIIIAMKTLIGFVGEVHTTIINWPLLLTITGLAVLGIFIGTAISKKINGEKLKPTFGWFILIVGIGILIKELLIK